MAQADRRFVIHTTWVRSPRAGDLIRGDIRVPEGPPSRTAVIVVHGFKGFKDWGFFPHACRHLAAAGHAVVSFNFSRNGVGAALADFDELEKFGANTLGIEQDELLMVVDEVIDGGLLSRRPDHVGLLGHSRGGAQSVLAAARDRRIASLVTWAAVSDFDRWSAETKAQWRAEGRTWIMNQRTGQQMPLDVTLLEDFEANRDRLDVRAAARGVAVPWLIVHGEDDLTVPVAEGEALARLSDRARVLRIDGAGHTFEARHPFVASTPELDRALEATVSHFRATLDG